MTDPERWYDEHGAAVFEGNPDLPIRKGYEWPAVRSLLPDLDGKRVLDAGCGAGQFAARLAERGADVLGVDASTETLALAREEYGGAATFRHADLREGLPFLDDASVDLVVSQLALDHVENWRPVFEAFERILVADGAVVCSVNHPPFLWGKMVRTEAGLDDPTYFETERWQGDLLGRSGDEWDGVTFYRRPLAEQIGPALDAGFVLDGFEEPTPTEAFRREKPEKVDQRLRRPPTFVCYRFRKPR